MRHPVYLLSNSVRLYYTAINSVTRSKSVIYAIPVNAGVFLGAIIPENLVNGPYEST